MACVDDRECEVKGSLTVKHVQVHTYSLKIR